MVARDLQLRMVERGGGACCASVLAELPAWFGIPEANADYVDMAERNPTVVASIEGETVGILTVDHHFDTAAEIHVMAVVPDLHRHGIGVALLEHAERRLIDRGVAYLQVKTLADAHPDAGYVRTRAFYLANGFVPLEVFPTLWGAANPALQMIKHLDAATGTGDGR